MKQILNNVVLGLCVMGLFFDVAMAAHGQLFFLFPATMFAFGIYTNLQGRKNIKDLKRLDQETERKAKIRALRP